MEKDELSIDDYIRDDDIPAYKLQSRNHSKDDKHEDIPFSGGTTFHEHLTAQLGLRIMTERQRNIAEYIIGNIDEMVTCGGRLRRLWTIWLFRRMWRWRSRRRWRCWR